MNELKSEVVNCEVLFLLLQAAASTCSPLPGPDIQDAWPQWNNTRIILADARYPAIDAFYLVRTVATERRTWISCRLMWWSGVLERGL